MIRYKTIVIQRPLLDETTFPKEIERVLNEATAPRPGETCEVVSVFSICGENRRTDSVVAVAKVVDCRGVE